MNAPNAPRITINPAYHIGKRKAGMYVARFLEWEEHCAGKQAAVDRLVSRLSAIKDNMFKRRYIVTEKATFALFYSDGWGYDIVRHDGTSSYCSTLLGMGTTFDKAYESMSKHAKEYTG